MRKSIHKTIASLSIAVAAAASFAAQAQTLQEAADAAGVSKIKSVEFSGTGRWYQFGQAPNPESAWPPFEVKSYTGDINYETVSARVQSTRFQVVEPGRFRPAPVEQRNDQFISGNTAWNESTTGNTATEQPAPVEQRNDQFISGNTAWNESTTGNTATEQPAAVEERVAEIWSTPQGFLKAAIANNGTSKPLSDGIEVSFTVGGKYHYVGTVNAKNQVTEISTWIDNPVLGDTLVETKFFDYKDFGGIQFPSQIVRTQGGHPVLDINVATAKANPNIEIKVPQDLTKAPAVNVASEKISEGVFYLTGGTHHSLAIDQTDHITIVEAPQNEERSLAVIAKAKELIPNKPIKYLINTHAHFDHAGGLRTFVDEGASIVTLKANKPYYEKVWATPHSIHPDRLEVSKKAPNFVALTDKCVLADEKHPIEIHSIANNGHNDAFVLAYLPNDKVLIEADAYTPLAANAPVPTTVNPYSANLYENIQKLNLNVEKIAALHGPRLVTLADLQAYIGIPQQVAAK